MPLPQSSLNPMCTYPDVLLYILLFPLCRVARILKRFVTCHERIDAPVSVVLCLPAHLRVSRSVPWPATHGNASVSLDGIQVELFASQQQHIMQLYCSKHLNNAFLLFWKAMGLVYANHPFSLLANLLIKSAHEGGRIVMFTPDWGCSGEHTYWRRVVDQMTVGRV